MNSGGKNTGWGLAAAAMVLFAGWGSILAQSTGAQTPLPSSPSHKAQSGVTQTQTPDQTKQTHGAAASQAKVIAAAPVQPLVAAGTKAADGVLVDQVIGVVNGDLILESDVEEERRLAAFQPYRDFGGSFSRDQAIQRLVDRTLILQQAKLQPEDAVTLDQAKAQLQELRKNIPACKQYQCETDAGWDRFVHDQGFTVDELNERWRERMQTLKFIEQRFRMGIRITPEEIKTYYEKSLLPEYAKRGVMAPKLETISDRIQEVLLQKQVGSLLEDWLKSLKAQGSVRMIRPGEVQP